MSASSSPAEDRPWRLSASDAETLAVYVAELSAGNLPLAPGLRAAADEVGGRMAHNLRAMAGALDRGQSLEDILNAPAHGFPHYLRGLVRAGLRTGRLGETLVELVEHRRAARESWRRVTSALAYPAILLGLTLGLYFVFATYLAPVLRSLVADFDVKLPLASLWLLWVGETGAVPITGVLLGAAAVAGVARVALGAETWRRSVAAIPLFGPLWHWSAVAEMARLMALLTKHRVPLPDALRLSGDGMEDANVAAVCRELADRVEQGRELATLIVVSPRLPSSLGPILRWGEATGRLAEAFEAAAEMFEGRVRMRAAVLRAILPPFAFLVTASLAAALFFGFAAPLISLLQNLM